MCRLGAAALLSFLSATAVYAAAPTCGPDNKCPESAPCCSAYGQCGVGAYCLGGCDPVFSHQLNSCVPAPVCKSADFKFNTLDGVQANTAYLGDASSTNWVSSGQAAVYNGDSVLLTMAPDTVGTLLASTHYVWYGKISANLSTSRAAGVVTAFIMMSDVKDEIDFEFVGTDLGHAQSNYYSQGVTVYTHGDNLATSDTFANLHTYTIDWKPDSITWLIDGNVMRTLGRSSTWNSTSNRYDFPQTPSRIMLSLWPAGLPSNGKGTIDWAGGLIDWNSPLMTNGYYYARVSDVTVECYDPPTGVQIAGSKSYVYTDAAGTNNTVKITDDMGILSSFYATGENEKFNPSASSSASASKTSTASASASSSEVPETVPGISGAGSRGEDTNSVASGGTTTAAPAPAATGSTGSSSGSGSSGFVQGDTPSSSSQSGAPDQKERVVQGSVFAVLVAIVALVAL